MPGSVEEGVNNAHTEPSQQIDVMVSEKDVNEEHVSEVLYESIQTALQDEQAQLVEAVMRSKADAPLTSDGIVLVRLKRVGRLNDVVAALLESAHLHGPISRVMAAGCDVRPAWTPAILLVPLTQTQVGELDVELGVHHIIAHETHKDLIIAALKALPSRQRPSVCMPPPSQSSPPGGDDTPNAMTGMPVIEVERTFVNYRIPKDISEVSDIACTAPCGGDVSAPQPINPRRWG